MSDLRTAAQQALERLRKYHYGNGFAEDAECIADLEAALAQQAEPVEPVAWMCSNPELMAKGYERFSSRCEGDWNIPVYTAPPQRKPLTEEEILEAVGWERAEMYMKLTPNFPVDEAKQETLKNACAVERAVWEKNHG